MKVIDGIEYYKSGEIMKMFGITASTLQDWRDIGKIKFCKFETATLLYTKEQVQNTIDLIQKEKEEKLKPVLSKICNWCGKEKNISDFYFIKKRNTYRAHCKQCNINDSVRRMKNNPEKAREIKRREYAKNPEKFKKKVLDFRKKFPEKVKHSNKNYYDNNKKKILDGCKEWAKNNPEKVRAIQRNSVRRRKITDVVFKFTCSVRSGIKRGLKRGGEHKKLCKSEELLGCSFKNGKQYIESLFVTDGIRVMSWENHGIEWELDHIIPCSEFNLLLEDSQRKCFNYSNLQPLWREDNQIKRDSLDWQKDPSKYQPIIKDSQLII